MSIPNVPEGKVMVELDHDFAELLQEDADAAVHQILSTIIEMQSIDASRDTIEKLSRLMEAKRHLKAQIELALEGL